MERPVYYQWCYQNARQRRLSGLQGYTGPYWDISSGYVRPYYLMNSAYFTPRADTAGNPEMERPVHYQPAGPNHLFSLQGYPGPSWDITSGRVRPYPVLNAAYITPRADTTSEAEPNRSLQDYPGLSSNISSGSTRPYSVINAAYLTPRADTAGEPVTERPVHVQQEEPNHLQDYPLPSWDVSAGNVRPYYEMNAAFWPRTDIAGEPAVTSASESQPVSEYAPAPAALQPHEYAPEPRPSDSNSPSIITTSASPEEEIQSETASTQQVGVERGAVTLFECTDCKEFKGQPMYQCVEGGHLVCAACKERAFACRACGSRSTQYPKMEKVTIYLTYPCKNWTAGCRVSFRWKNKKSHEQDCDFRHYFCIVSHCLWEGYKPDLIDHMLSTHHDKVRVGCNQNFSVSLFKPATNNIWIVSAYDKVFKIVFFHAGNIILYGFVIFMGSAEKAKNYRYTFTINGEHSSSVYRKIVYTRSTHSEDEALPNRNIKLNSTRYNLKDIISIKLHDANIFKKHDSFLPIDLYIDITPNIN